MGRHVRCQRAHACVAAPSNSSRCTRAMRRSCGTPRRVRTTRGAYARTARSPTEAALQPIVGGSPATHDPMVWAVRPVATGVVSGWLALMDIQPAQRGDRDRPHLVRPAHAAHPGGDGGDVPAAAPCRGRAWLPPAGVEVQRAQRAVAPGGGTAGFPLEGVLRAHCVVKGRRRDSAMFSILAEEWPACRDAIAAWLDPANFAPDGTATRGLASLRA